MNCINCGKELTGNQKKFCSRKCKYEYYKKENEGISYNSAYSKRKDAHGVYLKYKLIKYKGGKCECCGYDKNIAALQFHHLDPTTKKFTLDSRTIERKSDEEILQELSKCKLLCANCHAELHNPEMAKENCGKFEEASKGIKRRKPHNLDILNISQCSE